MGTWREERKGEGEEDRLSGLRMEQTTTVEHINPSDPGP